MTLSTGRPRPDSGQINEECGWIGCTRRGVWLGMHRRFCSEHHPATRERHEALVSRLTFLEATLRTVRDELEAVGDAIDVSDLWPHWNTAHIAVLDAIGPVSTPTGEGTPK